MAVHMAKAKGAQAPYQKARTRSTVVDGVPIVSTISRAAVIFQVSEPELARLVDAQGLEVWGYHHSGDPVFQFRELVTMVTTAGLSVPQPVRSSWRRYRAGKRKRVTAYGEEQDK
jgi:hypothetical protein